MIRNLVVGAAIVAAAASQLLGGPAAYVIVSGRSMEPSLHTGDLVLLLKRDGYRRGDVVAFRVPAGEPGAGGIVIHRIVGGSETSGYVTKGDNRHGADPWRPRRGDVMGSRALHVPRVGLILAAIASPLGLALAGGVLIFLLVSGTGNARPQGSGRFDPRPSAVRTVIRRPSPRANLVYVRCGGLFAVAVLAAGASATLG